MTNKRPNTDNYLDIFLNDRPLMDVRAPVEFSKGAFAHSTNLPLINDREREQVGICYKQQGQTAAIALGNALVCGQERDARIAAWTQYVQNNPEGYLYCFRGGLRSHTVQAWLREQSIDYPLVTGGYKALRRFLIDEMEHSVNQCRFFILSGKTGTGKTRLLTTLPGHVDLEGLANHRGSSFGRRIGGQPNQIDFENALSVALLKERHFRTGTVILEDESKLIGRCSLSQEFREKMQLAPILLLEEDLEYRVQITLEEYVEENLKENIAAYGEEGFEHYAEALLASLDRIRKRLGGARHQELRATMEQALTEQRNGSVARHRDWIRTLLADYYDPMYEYQLANKQGEVALKGDRNTLRQWVMENLPNQSAAA